MGTGLKYGKQAAKLQIPFQAARFFWSATEAQELPTEKATQKQFPKMVALYGNMASLTPRLSGKNLWGNLRRIIWSS